MPDNGSPGEWVDAGGPITECLRGIHACHVRDLISWIDDELWRIELAGQIVEREAGVIAERGRLVGRVEEWSPQTAGEFAEACAWRAREHAMRRLQRGGLAAERDELAAAGSLDEAERTAASLARRLVGPVADAAAFAADCIALACGRRPEVWIDLPPHGSLPAQTPGATAANLGFVVAHSGGCDAGDAGGAYADGFAAERVWQTSWLVERLRLPAP